jgi:hypothetical protein
MPLWATAASKTSNHPCESEFVTWGGVYHGRRRQVKMFFTSCIVPHQVGTSTASQVIEILVIVG